MECLMIMWKSIDFQTATALCFNLCALKDLGLWAQITNGFIFQKFEICVANLDQYITKTAMSFIAVVTFLVKI